jgi:Sulfotransferase family
MVSHEARVLFVHVQKTGGSTIDAYLRAALPDGGGVNADGGGRHARLRRILNNNPDLTHYWIFGFVRNPWARLLSWHSMILRRRDAAAAGDRDTRRRIRKNGLWRAVIRDYPDFDHFVLRGLDEIPTVGWPQVSYLQSKNRIADFIGRQETFDADMRAVLARIGLEVPAEFGRTNAAPEQHDYRDAYTPAMTDKVAQVFRRDLRAFAYEF